MNKLSNYFLMLFMSATVIFVSSCGEDDEILPVDTGATITGLATLDGTPVTSIEGAPGESVIIDVAYTVDSDVTGATLTSNIGDSTYQTLPVSSTSASPVQTNLILPTDLEDDVTIDYQIQDADGSILASEELTVEIDATVLAEVYQETLLDAPLDNRTSETFFSASTGEVYTLQEVVDETEGVTSDSIHFGYYYLTSTGAALASPAEYNEAIYDLGPNGANWGTVNNTRFRRIPSLTSEGFDDVNLSSDVANQFETSADAATDSGDITQLTVGQVYAFRFDEGDQTRFGIFRIDDIEPGDGENGSITLTIKIAAS